MILLALGYWTKLFLAITQRIEKSQLYTFLRRIAAWLDAGAQLGPFSGLYVGTNTLAAYDATNLQPGARVWVPTVRGWFTLIEDAGTLTPDARTIVTANTIGTPVRHWVWDGASDPSWLQQATWFVDGTNGNDENEGRLVGSPVKTLREIFERRLGFDAILGPAVTVTVANVASGDALNGRLQINNSSAPVPLKILGTEVVDYTGAFSAGTADLSQATPSMTVIADAAVGDFAAHVGRFVEITASANPARVGAVAPIVKRVTATTANTGAFVVPDDAWGFSPSRVAPTSGDSYKIVHYPAVPVGTFEIGQSSSSAPVPVGGRLSRLDLFSTGGYGEIRGGDTLNLMLNRCKLRQMNFAGSVSTNACHVGTTCYIRGSNFYGFALTVSGGALVANAAGASRSLLDSDSLFFGPGCFCALGDSTFTTLCAVGFFESNAGAALDTGVGTMIRNQTYNGTALLYGTGNAALGIRLKTGSVLAYTTKPEINKTLGAGRETLIGGTDKQYAAIPYVNPANNAELVALA